MSRLAIKENLLIDSYINHMYIKTRNDLMTEMGSIDITTANFETAIELGSIFMYNFGKTNRTELDDFIQKYHIEFSESKIKSFMARSFNQRVEVDCDFDTLLDKTIANYDISKNQAANFLAEIGIPDGLINTFKKNAENIRDLGFILASDYFYYTDKRPQKEEFEGKHLITIFKSLGDDYKNMTVGFTDNHDWKYENQMLVMPKNGFIQHGSKNADIINSYGSGYEMSALMRDKAFFDKVNMSWFEGYIPSNAHSEILASVKLEQEEKNRALKADSTKPRITKSSPP